jgi:tetratricopeptide (TPR) repeat protein
MKTRILIATAAALTAAAAFLLGGGPASEPVPAAASSVPADELALKQHRFRDALELGQQARRRSPLTARNYGVIGDALVELGRYRAGFRAYDRMGSLKPSYSSYARISHARELVGDTPGALEAMELAVRAAGTQPRPLAWARVHVGLLHLDGGRLGPARREFRAALLAAPGYAEAFAGLARVEAARGRLERAIRLQLRAVAGTKEPGASIVLGDLYLAAGERALARSSYARAEELFRREAETGARIELETALFDVDRGVRLKSALARARRAHAERPSVEADHVLAWALLRNGRCEEARRYSRRALRLGTLDVDAIFHRALIERCLGREAAARSWARRALAVNPYFTRAPDARRLVGSNRTAARDE